MEKLFLSQSVLDGRDPSLSVAASANRCSFSLYVHRIICGK